MRTLYALAPICEHGFVRRVIGSLLAVTGGWLATLLAYAVLSAALNPAYQTWTAWWFEILFMAAFIGSFVVTMWLFAFLPVYLVLPRESVLWRPSRSVPLGAVAGAAAIAVWGWGRIWFHTAYGPFLGLGALAGGASGLLASATAHRFLSDGAGEETR